MDLLDHLVRAPASVAPITSLGEALERIGTPPLPHFDATIDRAAAAGFASDRLGYAFVGGYQAALARLAAIAGAEAPPEKRRCLAATEAGGGHPRAIETKLEQTENGLVLRGTKTFATLASVADEIFVVASRGGASDGKNALALVRVKPGAPGMTLTDRAPLPFAPEVPHARLVLDGVAVRPEDVLEGDGYARYVKPFRTIEDLHVLAASLGLMVRLARVACVGAREGSHVAALTKSLALLAGARALADRERALGPEPALHLALAGLFDAARPLLTGSAALFPDAADADLRARWERDLPLLLVAETARQKRTLVALEALAALESGK